MHMTPVSRSAETFTLGRPDRDDGVPVRVLDVRPDETRGSGLYRTLTASGTRKHAAFADYHAQQLPTMGPPIQRS